MSDPYFLGFMLCSVALFALIFAQPYIRSDLMQVLRVSASVGLIGFGVLAMIDTHAREAQTIKHQQETANIQDRIDKFKLRQADLKSRFDALAAEEAKAPHDPVIQKDLASQRLELTRESAASKAELDDIQKELDANKQ